MATPDAGSLTKGDPAVRSGNSIRARRIEVPGGEGLSSAARSQASASPLTNSVPEAVRERFIQVRNKYYFPDGERAFTDRGKRLTTPSENTEVVRSLIAIAKAREWSAITVRGTERFRRDAWLMARMAGLEVRGYRPSEVENARLSRTQRTQNALSAGDGAGEPGSPPAPSADTAPARASSRGGLVTGTLIEHGRANYQQDPHAPMSYFVKVRTPGGERTVWGVDLERALRESVTKPQVGQEVGLRAIRRDTVKVKTVVRGVDARVVGERSPDAYRNRWIIERRDFFDERAAAARAVRQGNVDPKEAVKRHPELVGTYLQLHAAELAAKRLSDPRDRQLFVDQIRSALADSIARGESQPAVRLRERPLGRSREARQRASARVRE